MKLAAILSLALSGLFTAPVFADDSTSTSLSGASSELKLDSQEGGPWSRLNPRIVPQLGMSSMQYTGAGGGSPGQGFAGGVTTELGTSKARLAETGILFIQSNAGANIGPNGSSQTVSSSEIAIPLMAKIRFIDSRTQSWYFKIGATTTFETATNANTSAFDILAGGGVGVRLPVSKKMDLLVEATYNRGMLDALQNAGGVTEGVLGFIGLSIGL
jgi:hypothetical protein